MRSLVSKQILILEVIDFLIIADFGVLIVPFLTQLAQVQELMLVNIIIIV